MKAPKRFFGRTLIFVSVALALAFITFRILSSSQSVDFDNLTVQELTENGFYAYIVANEDQKLLEWEQTIWMKSFDFHCAASRDSTWNPVTIMYKDRTGSWVFDIRISPEDAIWDNMQSSTPIPLQINWASASTTEYQLLENGLAVRITDTRGMDVIVTSSLTLSDTIRVINGLQYVGDAQAFPRNPWVDICESFKNR